MPKSARREANLSNGRTKDVQTEKQDCTGLLKTIDKSLEDIRDVITCRVCVKPLYEPFTIECGHTFCYSCLVSWFEKNTARKSCPDCRAKITRKPAPAYLVREVTQLFSVRAELLPAGETTQEHQDQQQEEARILEEDKNGRGLFRGSFRNEELHLTGFGNRIIIDDEDGVNRCPRCTWEMEDEICASCGWPGEADSWDPYSGSEVASDEDELLRALEDEEDDVDEDEEDDSDGSLDRFVVNDEQIGGARHRSSGADRPLHLQHQFLGPNGSLRGRSRPSLSSVDVNTGRYESDSEVLTVTSDDNTDAPSLFGGRSSRSLSSDSPSNEVSSTMNGRMPSSPRYLLAERILDESDDESNFSIPTESSNTERPRRNRASTPRSSGYRLASRDVAQIRSDSAESESRSSAQWRRRTSNPSLVSDNYLNQAVQYLTSDDEDTLTNARPRPAQSNAGPMQATRRRAARPIVIDEEDEEDKEDNSRAAQASHEQIDDTLRALLAPGQVVPELPQQQRRALPGPSLPIGRVPESIQNNIHPPPRLDPSTSMPIRRENANMPGAFPPSFVSEQGQLQSTPPVDRGFFTSSNSSDRGSASRPARAPEENGQVFLDRRHSGQQTSTHVQQPRRRDRSAAKATRRQERERRKAEIGARGRRGGEPSAPP